METSGQYLLKSDLIERGWTKQLVSRYYGVPLKFTKTGTIMDNVNIYEKSVVETIENSCSFKGKFMATLENRAEQVVSNRYNFQTYKIRRQEVVLQSQIINMFQSINNTTIRVFNLDVDVVLRKVFNGIDEQIALELIKSNQARHHLSIVEYIRKHESNYTVNINNLNSINESADTYGMNFKNFNLCRHVLKQKTNNAIAATYPFLAKECARQNSLLFRWHPRGDAYRNVYFDYAA